MKAYFAFVCLVVCLAGCERSAPQTPILAQSEMFNYGNGEYLGFEGKIYNPNSSPIINVRVRWQVYPPWNGDSQTEEFLTRAGFERSCGFSFAYIPAKTTYDFKTEKIKARTADVMDSIGQKPYPPFLPSDLKPEITFAPER